MKKLLIVFSLSIGLSYVSIAQNNFNKELLEADKAFCNDAQRLGMGQAFIKYADEEAIILQGGRETIKGIDDIRKVYSQIDSSRLSLVWQPIIAEASKAGDIGYTYGSYTLTIKGAEIQESKGFYLSVWKKQEDGSWKYVADVGSPGPQ